jgi:NAD(P)-dependent dehydrogenase (short-subunit alcohol dehydrogenase family)
MALKGLTDRIVLVTGGASGIGLATATRLLEEGARVAIVDIDAEAIDRELDRLDRDRVLGVVADVSAETDVARAFSEAHARFGRIDAVHNNAGIERPPAALVDTKLSEFEQLIAVNLKGAYLVLREMLRTATRQDSPATIVNTSSGTALHTVPGMGLYAATKAALISLTRTAAVEMAGAGVRVNAIVPGPIDTHLFARISPDVRAKVEAGVPAGRIGTPEEVAALAAWLLSDESAFVNGGVYTVDGAETA